MIRRHIRRLGIASAGVVVIACTTFVMFYHVIYDDSNFWMRADERFASSHFSSDALDQKPCLLDSTKRFRCPHNVPCLHKLVPATNQDETKDFYNKSKKNIDTLLDKSSIQEINRLPGAFDPVHYYLISLITSIQWENEIYGSVAEFGVDVGKFTSLLARNMDVEVGERLLIADSFKQPLNRRLSVRGRLTQIDIFTTILRKYGFDERNQGPRKLHIHRGEVEELQVDRLKQWRLPQLRLVSVSVQPMNTTRHLHLFDLVSCLLLEGGILIVGGIDEQVFGKSISSSNQTVLSEMAEVFALDGTRWGLEPFLLTADKLYVATVQWSEKFLKKIKENAELLHLHFSNAHDSDTFLKDLPLIAL